MKKLEDLDMVNTQFPSLQNPLFEYLSSEGKEESFYEARFKNAIEGALNVALKVQLEVHYF